MPKFFLVSYIFPYIAGAITYMVLKVLRKEGKLKKFDRYLWSPFVVSFAGVGLFLIIVLFVFNGGYGFVFKWNLSDAVFFIIIFSQILWISLILQFLAIFFKNRLLLKLAAVFALMGMLLPIILILCFLSYRGS